MGKQLAYNHLEVMLAYSGFHFLPSDSAFVGQGVNDQLKRRQLKSLGYTLVPFVQPYMLDYKSTPGKSKQEDSFIFGKDGIVAPQSLIVIVERIFAGLKIDGME